jgi:hypothetical protein
MKFYKTDKWLTLDTQKENIFIFLQKHVDDNITFFTLLELKSLKILNFSTAHKFDFWFSEL